MGTTAKKQNKWLTFMIICLTCGIITELLYLRWALYEPLRETLGQSNTEFSMSMSLFGVLAAILYIPGGWIADSISHRKLFATSAIRCGLLGLWFSTIPSFQATLIIHALWVITNIGIFDVLFVISLAIFWCFQWEQSTQQLLLQLCWLAHVQYSLVSYQMRLTLHYVDIG